MRIIQGQKGRDKYYIDEDNMTVTDKEGNCIKLYESTKEMSDSSLAWALDIMFHNLYKISNNFKNSCIADKRDKIDWG